MNVTGSQNTASGYEAMMANTNGSQNTAVGYQALEANTMGSNNIALGFGAGARVAGANSNNIHIGNTGQAGDAGVIRIGTAAVQAAFFAAGIRGMTTGNNDALPVVIDSAGQLGTVSSSARFKEDVRDMGETSSGVLRLRPVTFRYRKAFADGGKPVQYGLIAEEVEKVMPELVARSADGEIESVKYQMLDALLLNELQKAMDKIRALEERVEELEGRREK